MWRNWQERALGFLVGFSNFVSYQKYISEAISSSIIFVLICFPTLFQNHKGSTTIFLVHNLDSSLFSSLRIDFSCTMPARHSVVDFYTHWKSCFLRVQRDHMDIYIYIAYANMASIYAIIYAYIYNSGILIINKCSPDWNLFLLSFRLGASSLLRPHLTCEDRNMILHLTSGDTNIFIHFTCGDKDAVTSLTCGKRSVITYWHVAFPMWGQKCDYTHNLCMGTRILL